jgi:hypothetical protein
MRDPRLGLRRKGLIPVAVIPMLRSIESGMTVGEFNAIRH